jgi:hypothetical protein
MELYTKILAHQQNYKQTYKGIQALGDSFKYSSDKKIAYFKAIALYNEYNEFFTNKNMSKDGGNCGSNQAFYKSMEFYDFMKPRSINNTNYYIIDLDEFKKWYETQENASSFIPATEEEIKGLIDDYKIDF